MMLTSGLRSWCVRSHIHLSLAPGYSLGFSLLSGQQIKAYSLWLELKQALLRRRPLGNCEKIIAELL